MYRYVDHQWFWTSECKFKFKIETIPGNTSSGNEDMINWLNETIGNNWGADWEANWEAASGQKLFYYFKYEKDAIHFKLRWS